MAFSYKLNHKKFPAYSIQLKLVIWLYYVASQLNYVQTQLCMQVCIYVCIDKYNHTSYVILYIHNELHTQNMPNKYMYVCKYLSMYRVSYKQVVPTVACKLLEKTVLPFCIPIITVKKTVYSYICSYIILYNLLLQQIARVTARVYNNRRGGECLIVNITCTNTLR